MKYYQDERITLYHGDALEVAKSLPAGSVDCIVTSPPYFGLRDYGAEGQYGLEKSPAEYVETMRGLFSELRRVLSDDGTLWLNIGDTYKAKNLLGIPWQVAFALQKDGWFLRNEIIWNKPNAMPEPTKDRFSRKYESVFLFSKKQKYWFDVGPLRVPVTSNNSGQSWESRKKRGEVIGSNRGLNTVSTSIGNTAKRPHKLGKNPGDVWQIVTGKFKEAHFATFPPELPRRCVVSGCKPGGVVLDPFSGSGTTGMVAVESGRKYVGIDLNSEYLDLSLRTRLNLQSLPLDVPC